MTEGDQAVDGLIAVSEPVFNPLWVGVRVGPGGALEHIFPEAPASPGARIRAPDMVRTESAVLTV